MSANVWEEMERNPPQPAPPQSGNVRQEMENRDTADDNTLRMLFDAGIDKAPDRQAGVLELARQTRIPADEIDKNFDEVSRLWKQSQFDPAKFRRSNPGIAEWILRNPHVAPIAIVEAPKIGILTALWRSIETTSESINAVGYPPGPIVSGVGEGEGPEGIQERQSAAIAALREETKPVKQEMIVDPSAHEKGLARFTDMNLAEYRRGQAINAYGLAGWKILTGRGGFEQEKAAADARNAMLPRYYGQGPWEQSFLDASNQLPMTIESAKAGGVAGAVGAVGGATVGALARSKKLAMEGAKFGWKLGSKAGVFAQSLQVEAGSTFLDLRGTRLEDGTIVSEDMARGGALAYGIPAAALETESFGMLAKTLGPIGEAIAKGEGKAFLRSALKQKGFRELLTRVGKQWIKAAATEGSTEAIQRILQDVAGYFTKSAAQGRLRDVKPEEVADTIAGAVDEGMAAFRGSLVIGGATSVIGASAEISAIKEAEGNWRRVVGLSQASKEVQTVRAAPGLVAELIAQQTKSDGKEVTHAYIDPEAFTTFFQEGKADPSEAAAQILGPEGPQKLQDALDTGGRLEVPMAAYLEKVVSTPAGEALAMDTAFSLDQLTAREAPAALAAAEKKAQELAKKIKDPLGNSPAVKEFLASTVRQLIATGRYSGHDAARSVAIASSMMRTQLEIFNRDREEQGMEPLSADELFGQYEMRIRTGEAPTTGGAKDISLTQTFYQSSPAESPRGSLRIIRDLARTVFDTTLFEKADYSTFLHESGHAFLEIFADLADREDAPERIKRDWEATKRLLEVESRDQIGKPQHERWAQAFERYLSEGKAPSLELVGSFERFWIWLKNLYRDMTTFGADISDEVRGVFDRLLATDEEIALARSAQALESMFESPAQAGMSPADFAAHMDEIEKARVEQAAIARAAVLLEQRRAASEVYRAERELLRREATAEVNARPEYQAQYWLRTGKALIENPALEGIEHVKLDRAAVERLIGAERVADLGRGRNQITAAEGGIHPDEIAELFGFDSGQAMLRALLGAGNRTAEISKLTRERLEERHPDLVVRMSQLRSQAVKALHNPSMERAIGAELQALARKVGEGTASLVAAVNYAARRLAENSRISEIQSGRSLAAEARAGARAAEALRRGDDHRAFQYKFQQMVNLRLFREALDIQDRLDAGERLFKRMATPETRAHLIRANPALADASDAILEAIGKKPKETSIEALSNRKGLDAALQIMRENGHDPDVLFDQSVIRRILNQPQSFESLTVRDHRAIVSALRAISASAEERTTVVVAGEKISIEDAEALAIDQLKKSLPRRKKIEVAGDNKARNEKWRATVEGWDAALLPPETLVEFMDGREPDGFFRRFIWNEYLKAREKRDQLAERFLARIDKAWEKLPAELRKRASEKVEWDLPLSEELAKRANFSPVRSTLWMIALNMGNAGNKERLLGGFGWSEAEVKERLDSILTAEEFQLVQDIQNILEELWPEIAAKEERVHGVAPEKVEATPVVTKYGTFRGGYFPAKYNPEVSAVGERQSEDSLAAFKDPNYISPVTFKSHTKARAKKFSDVVDLSWRVVPAHVLQVIHDVAFDEYVRNTARLLLRKPVKDTIADRLGQERAKQWIPWLKSVANFSGRSIPSELQAAETVTGWARSRTSLAALGWNISIAAGDLSNPLIAVTAGKVKARNVSLALIQCVQNPIRAYRDALERSSMLRHRRSDLIQQMRLRLGDMAGPASRENPALQAIRRSAYVFMETTERITSTVIWWAAYRQNTGLEPGEAARRADTITSKILPAIDIPENPTIIREKAGIGSMLIFYGFLNKMYAIQREAAHEAFIDWHDPEVSSAGKARSIACATGRLLGIYVAYNVLGEFLTGRGPEEDESWLQWFLRKVVSAPFNTLPFMGTAVDQGIGYAMTGKRPQISLRNAPALAALEYLGKQAMSGYRLATGEAQDPEKAALDVLEGVGFVAGVPTRQVRKTGSYLADLARGEEEFTDPADAASGIIYGKRERQPKNPLSAASDVIQGE